MKYARLGSSGLVVSRLGLGMMSYGDNSTRDWHLDAEPLQPRLPRASPLSGRPGVTAPVVGATKASHLRDAVAAVDLEPTPGEVARLEANYRPHRVLGHD